MADKKKKFPSDFRRSIDVNNRDDEESKPPGKTKEEIIATSNLKAKRPKVGRHK